MTMWQVFPDHQKRYFEDAFSNNQLFWCLVSPDSKDALTAICQKLTFLLDISLNHCLFFTDNLWWFEFKWSENLAQGCWPNFLGLTTKALITRFSMRKWTAYFTKPPTLNKGEIKIRKTYSYDTVYTYYVSLQQGFWKIEVCWAIVLWQYQYYLKYQYLVL